MICYAFQNPNNLIPHERHSLSKIKVISKPRFELNAIPFTKEKYYSHLSSRQLLPLKFPTQRRRTRREMVTEASDASAIMLTSGASGRNNALLSLRALSNLWWLIMAFLLILVLPFRGRHRVAVATAFSAESGDKGGGKNEKPSTITGKVVRLLAAIVARKGQPTAEVPTRRALAINRVVEDNGDKTVRDFSLFVTSRGDTIFTQSWTPARLQIRGLVIVLHGLNEHSGRYSIFAKKLNVNGFKVYGMDWIGHGGTDGLHAYVHSLDDAVDDMKMFLKKVLAENPAVPCFCFGHSTGGAIIIKAAIDPQVQQCLSGIVLTSPAIGVQPSHPIFTVLAPIFSWLFPRFQFSAANKRGIAVSRDPKALMAKYSDPLVFTGAIRVRTGYEILRITSYLQQNLSKLTVPFLVLHGTSDSVTDPKTSQKLYNEAASTDKTIELYDGLLHDLLFEPEKEEIMEAIIKWFVRRL